MLCLKIFLRMTLLVVDDFHLFVFPLLDLHLHHLTGTDFISASTNLGSCNAGKISRNAKSWKLPQINRRMNSWLLLLFVSVKEDFFSLFILPHPFAMSGLYRTKKGKKKFLFHSEASFWKGLRKKRRARISLFTTGGRNYWGLLSIIKVPPLPSLGTQKGKKIFFAKKRFTGKSGKGIVVAVRQQISDSDSRCTKKRNLEEREGEKRAANWPLPHSCQKISFLLLLLFRNCSGHFV